MKKKINEKKLKLLKETIVKLDASKLSKLIGGNSGAQTQTGENTAEESILSK
jgi:hypothetical protein